MGLSLGNYRLHVVLQNTRTPKLLINKISFKMKIQKDMYPDLSQWQAHRSNPTKSVVRQMTVKVRQMTVKITKYLI